MAKRVDYSLLVHRAYNLLKGVAEAIDYCTTKMYYSRTIGCLYASMGSSAKPSANLPTTAESCAPSGDRVVRSQDINPNTPPTDEPDQ